MEAVAVVVPDQPQTFSDRRQRFAAGRQVKAEKQIFSGVEDGKFGRYGSCVDAEVGFHNHTYMIP
jgi:hypothetical protein